MQSRADRALVTLDVAVEAAGQQVFQSAVNLSHSGVLLASDDPLPLGTQVRVVISLPPDGVFVRMHGTVVRHQPGQHGDPAFAVKFEAVDAETTATLARFVASA